MNSPVSSAISSEQSSTSSKQQVERVSLLSVIIPVYNERRTLRTLVNRVLNAALPIPLEIIIVDDASSDGSVQIMRELESTYDNVRVYVHDTNGGKAKAIRTGLKYANGQITIIQDADLEYDPAEFHKIISPILEGLADAVFGSRFATSEHRKVLYFWHSVANQILTLITNALCDLNLTDMETCYKAVRTDILRSIPLQCERFGFEPELTVRLAQWGARIYEVPISYSGRTYAEGKKITWRDGIQALVVLFWASFLNKRFTTHDGFYTLRTVRGEGLNKWMFEQFAPFVGRRILEAGCGTGNLSAYMLKSERQITADIDPLYVDLLSRKYGHLEGFNAILMDLSDQAAYTELAKEKLDTIVCSNVLEHIDDDDGVLQNFLSILEKGGRVVILVPQHKWLYCAIDETVCHVRRYTRKELEQKMRAAGFDVVHSQDFNRFGVFGWLVNGKLLGSRNISPFAMSLYNALVPIAKLIERLPFIPGLSVIVVGQKTANPT